jgi:hypothetical protein
MMFANATAADTASFGIIVPDYQKTSARAAKVAERYVKWFGNFQSVSRIKAETPIAGPTRIAAQWLTSVQERVYRSIMPIRQIENDGRWLSYDIAQTASNFFQVTSDVLPGEPYVYASEDGDLIAEFSAKHGTLTSIVTPTFVILFAVVDKGVPIERRFVFGSEKPTTLRRELQQLTKMLHSGRTWVGGHLKITRS